MTDYNINERWSLLDRSKAVTPLFRTMNLKVDGFFQEVPAVQANMGLIHRFSRDREMAASTNRAFYAGVGRTKFSKQVVYEHCMLKERRREIDEDELDTLGGDAEGKKEVLRQQDEAHIIKLGEDIVNAIFNGSVTDGGEHINGLKARLASLNPSGTGNGLNNVRSAGNANASYNSSIYVVEWNTQGGAFLIYPPNGMANTQYGVAVRDKKKEPKLDASDSTMTYYVYVAQFKAWVGLAVGDNLKIARIANINTATSGSKNFIDGNVDNILLSVLNNGHFDRARTRIYVNEDIMTQIEIYGKDKSNLNLSTGQVFGAPVPTFRGIPIRMLDNAIISSAETVVS